jgi:omega-amidase
MRIALISFEPEQSDIRMNLEKCRDLLNRIQEMQVDLCVFPETTLTGFSFPNGDLVELRENSLALDFFSSEAKRRSISIIFGLFLNDQNRIYNSAFAFSKSGELMIRYDKIHLFSPGGESKYNVAGNSISTGKLEEVRFGLTICYDLRFPELFTSLALTSKVIVNIANWPSKRESHWSNLLKSRAIENQVFIIGVNRSGHDSTGEFFAGNSLIYDPWGEEIVPELSEETVSVFSIDVDQVEKIRSFFPVSQDRRFKISLS